MKVKDLVSFSKETFFNGAVQTEWFYDAQKAKPLRKVMFSMDLNTMVYLLQMLRQENIA